MCEKRVLGSLSSFTHTTYSILYLTLWSRHSSWNKWSLAVKFTLHISNWGVKQGCSNKIYFSSHQVKFMVEEKIVIVSDWGIGMWGLGITGILTLIKVSFPDWILRCVLSYFCRANVFCFWLVFFSLLFSFSVFSAVIFLYWCAA